MPLLRTLSGKQREHGTEYRPNVFASRQRPHRVHAGNTHTDTRCSRRAQKQPRRDTCRRSGSQPSVDVRCDENEWTHVIEERYEDGQHCSSQNTATNTGSNPRERRITRPAKYEECNHQQWSRHQTKLDTDFRRRWFRPVSLVDLLVAGVEVDEVDDGGKNTAQKDAQKHQSSDACGESVSDAEDDRVCFEHKVDTASEKL